MSWQDKAEEHLQKKRRKGFTLDEGPNEIRVLPTKMSKRDKEPCVHAIYRAHSNVGPDKRFLICGKSEDGSGECWLDDIQIPKLEKSDSKAKRKQAEAMKPQEKMAMQIAYVKRKKWKGPELFVMNSGGKKSLAFRLLKTISNPKYNAIHLKKGRNVEIEREGQGLDTDYSAPVLQSERTEVPEKIVKQMKTFDELLRKYDERRMKAAYYGKDLDEESSSSENSSESEGDDSEMADKKKKKDSEDSEQESSSVSSSAASDSEDSEKDSSDADSEKSSSEAEDSEEGSSEKSSEKDSSEEDSEESSEKDSSDVDSEKSSEEESEAEDSDEEEKPAKKKKPGPKPKGKGKGKGKK